MAKNTVTHATSDFKIRCETALRVQKVFKKFVDPLDIEARLPENMIIHLICNEKPVPRRVTGQII